MIFIIKCIDKMYYINNDNDKILNVQIILIYEKVFVVLICYLEDMIIRNF